MKRILFILIFVIFCCGCNEVKRDIVREYTQQIINIDRSDLLISFSYIPCRNVDLDFVIYHESVDENHNICIKRNDTDKSEILFVLDHSVNLNDFFEHITIQQYSYNIITVSADNTDKWINIYEYLDDTEKQSFKTNRPKISDIKNDVNRAYLVTATDMEEKQTKIDKSELNKLLHEITLINEDDSQINTDGRPTWAIYAKIYIEHKQKICELKLTTDGIVYNGVFYNNDNETINDLLGCSW